MTTITGKYNESASWEKQVVYDLSNGWTATVEFSLCYGEQVSKLNCPNTQPLANGKTYWHCSEGLKDLPEFARSWLEVVVEPNTQVVRPRFTR